MTPPAPKISILVCAYNIERYIRRCLDSLLAQTMPDIEIVIADDCSTDGTPGIISGYAASDGRIKVVRHQENYGILWGRKTCVENASGDFLMFVDGDDSIELDACEIMYRTAMSTGADLVICGHDYHALDGTTIPFEFKLSHGSDGLAYAKSMVMSEMAHILWGKLYRRELWEGKPYSYQKGYNYSDDLLLSFELAPGVRKAVVIGDRLWHYYKNPTSMTELRLDLRALDNIMASSARMLDLVSGMDEETVTTSRLNVVRTAFNKIKRGYSRADVMSNARDNGLRELFTFSSLKGLLGLRKACSYWLATRFDSAAAVVARST